VQSQKASTGTTEQTSQMLSKPTPSPAANASPKAKVPATGKKEGGRTPPQKKMPGSPGDSDPDSASSSSSDSSQDDLENQFGAASPPKETKTDTGSRVIVQAMIRHDVLEKFVKKGFFG
jgi:hypothetical protein